MTHLFMGLDPRWVIREPYIPVVNTPGTLKAQTLDLRVHPRARVLVFPNVASYFGGDLIAGILFSEICHPGGTIALSGILLEQAERVRQGYAENFSIDDMQQQGDWVLLSGHRKSPS